MTIRPLIDVDPTSPVALYLQIAEQFRRLIALRALQPGDRLPTVRDLAVQVRVNRNTAARAIQHMESKGLVTTRVGRGTFVDSPVTIDRERREQMIDSAIERLIVEARTVGQPLEELGGRVAQAVERLQQKESHE
jgi:GntR family transcriptional regulator